MLTRTTEDQRQLLPMFTIIICTTLESETVGSFYRHLCEACTCTYVYVVCSSIHIYYVHGLYVALIISEVSAIG